MMKKSQIIRILTADGDGYLLIEALIAMAIFAVGFLAVGSMVVHTTRNNTRGNIMTMATLLASDTLENFKGTDDITALDIGTYADAEPVDESGNPGGIFTRTWEISDPLGYNTSRQISVTVNWTRQGRQRQITLNTITKGRGT
jgi:Tfp pilus assembly protein PilV